MSQDYDVKDCIGKGSFGDVFLAYKRGEHPRQAYVLKRIKLARQTAWQREATAREISLMQSLKHPFVVPFMETWTHNYHTVNVVLGYCEQGDLSTIMAKRKKPYDEQTLRRWLAQMLLALDYLEQRNVLHRDIKTGNIFLCKDGHVQLGDFGLASVKDLNDANAVHDQSLVGTPHFMSPELLSCKGYNQQTDVWSLGCVMYELSALKPAFNAFDLSGLIQKITRSNLPPMPKTFSHDWHNIIRSMLRKDPEFRPTVQQLLALPSLQHAVAEARRLARSLQPDVYLPPMAQSPIMSPSTSRTERLPAPETDMGDHGTQQQQWAESLQAMQSALPEQDGDAGVATQGAGLDLSMGGEGEESGAALHGRGVKRTGLSPGAAGNDSEEHDAAANGDKRGRVDGGEAEERQQGARGGAGGARGRKGAERGMGSVRGSNGLSTAEGGAGRGGGAAGARSRGQGDVGGAGRSKLPADAAVAFSTFSATGQGEQPKQQRTVQVPGKDSDGWGSGVKESAATAELENMPADPVSLLPAMAATANTGGPPARAAPAKASANVATDPVGSMHGEPARGPNEAAAGGEGCGWGLSGSIHQRGGRSGQGGMEGTGAPSGSCSRTGAEDVRHGREVIGATGGRPGTSQQCAPVVKDQAGHARSTSTQGGAGSGTDPQRIPSVGSGHSAVSTSFTKGRPTSASRPGRAGGVSRSANAIKTDANNSSNIANSGVSTSRSNSGYLLRGSRGSRPVTREHPPSTTTAATLPASREHPSPAAGAAAATHPPASSNTTNTSSNNNKPASILDRTASDAASRGHSRTHSSMDLDGVGAGDHSAHPSATSAVLTSRESGGSMARSSSLKSRPSKPTPSELLLEERQQQEAVLQARAAQESEALHLRRQQQAARLAALKEQQRKVQQDHQERLQRARQARGSSSSPARRPPSPSGRGYARAPAASPSSNLTQAASPATFPSTSTTQAASHAHQATGAHPASSKSSSATSSPTAVHTATGHSSSVSVHELWSPGGAAPVPHAVHTQHAHVGTPPHTHSSPLSAGVHDTGCASSGHDSHESDPSVTHVPTTLPAPATPPLYPLSVPPTSTAPPTDPAAAAALPHSQAAPPQAAPASPSEATAMEVDVDKDRTPQQPAGPSVATPARPTHTSIAFPFLQQHAKATAPVPSNPAAGATSPHAPPTSSTKTEPSPIQATTLSGLRWLRQSLSARKAPHGKSRGGAATKEEPLQDAAIESPAVPASAAQTGPSTPAVTTAAAQTGSAGRATAITAAHSPSEALTAASAVLAASAASAVPATPAILAAIAASATAQAGPAAHLPAEALTAPPAVPSASAAPAIPSAAAPQQVEMATPMPKVPEPVDAALRAPEAGQAPTEARAATLRVDVASELLTAPAQGVKTSSSVHSSNSSSNRGMQAAQAKQGLTGLSVHSSSSSRSSHEMQAEGGAGEAAEDTNDTIDSPFERQACTAAAAAAAAAACGVDRAAGLSSSMSVNRDGARSLSGSSSSSRSSSNMSSKSSSDNGSPARAAEVPVWQVNAVAVPSLDSASPFKAPAAMRTPGQDAGPRLWQSRASPVHPALDVPVWQSNAAAWQQPAPKAGDPEVPSQQQYVQQPNDLQSTPQQQQHQPQGAQLHQPIPQQRQQQQQKEHQQVQLPYNQQHQLQPAKFQQQQQQLQDQQQEQAPQAPRPSDGLSTECFSLSRQSTALSLPTPSNSGLHIYGLDEGMEELQGLENEGCQLSAELTEPCFTHTNQAAEVLCQEEHMREAVQQVPEKVQPSAGRTASGVCAILLPDMQHMLPDLGTIKDEGAPWMGSPHTGTQSNFGVVSRPLQHAASGSSSGSAQSTGSTFGGRRSAAAAAGTGQDFAGSAWKGMFSNAMFGQNSRHLSELDLVPLNAPTSESDPPHAMHGSEHAHTPGLLQAFPLKESSAYYHSHEEEEDDECRGLEDWSTPVHDKEQLSGPPQAPKSDSERFRLHQLERTLAEARSLLLAGQLAELGKLLGCEDAVP